MITIKPVLDIKTNKAPLYIEPSVLLFAYTIHQSLKNRIAFQGVYGIELLIIDVTRIVLKASIGVSFTSFAVFFNDIKTCHSWINRFTKYYSMDK
jgi:hypothetical protein